MPAREQRPGEDAAEATAAGPRGGDPRRPKVSFDPFHFDRLRRAGSELPLPEKFRRIHEQNLWHGPESKSGEGSGRQQTRALVVELPVLLRELGVEVLLDAPCGAYGWIDPVARSVRSYVGADVVPEVIAENARLHGSAGRRFLTLDLTRDPLPPADLVLSRDCLVHLSFADALAALANVSRSGATWLLTTTFVECPANEDIVSGDWRPLDLRRPPFDLPEPTRLIRERTPEGGGAFPDKALGLWRTVDLRDRPGAAAPRGR